MAASTLVPPPSRWPLSCQPERHNAARDAAWRHFPVDWSRFGLAPGGPGSYVAPPTQQRTCLWPSWLRNDVKRSGNRMVAGSFDRFVN